MVLLKSAVAMVIVMESDKTERPMHRDSKGSQAIFVTPRPSTL